MSKLRTIRLNGFRSIKRLELELRRINLLIGANGAGKSNLIAFFAMINEMMAGRLQQWIGAAGRAQAVLHFGPKTTPQLEFELEFATDNGTNTYHCRLFHGAGDSLVFAEEDLSYLKSGWAEPRPVPLGAGHQETRIHDEVEEETTARTLEYLMDRCRVYHFHDTSPTARVRQYCYLGHDRWLMPDAANLAAILYRLQTHEAGAYRRIVGTVRQIAPFLKDFSLFPSGPGGRDVILNWLHEESDLIFGPHQLSDGTLRAICLITLLLQPQDDLPLLIVIDEPARAQRRDEFASPHFRWLHACLKQAVYPTDKRNLEILVGSFHQLTGVSLVPEDVITLAEATHGDLLRAWTESLTCSLASDAARAKEAIVEYLVDGSDFRGLITFALNWFQEMCLDDAQTFSDYDEDRRAWQELDRALRGRTLSVYLQELDLRSKAPTPEPQSVTLWTIHAAKGREFANVYLVGLADKVLPSYQALCHGEQSAQLEEERRSCFVAITRTLETLTLTYADSYRGWKKQPSRFLREMGLLDATR